MERRLVLKLIAAGFFGPSLDAASPGRLISIAPAQAAATKPLFFTADELAMLEGLTEIIIPADDHSPGASAAKVNLYIDVIVSEGGSALQKQWKDGLGEVQKASTRKFKKAFAGLDARQRDQIVALMARNEAKPKKPLEIFFKRLKGMTIDGYYTSKIGIHEDLQYQGNTALAEFPGCTHPEHQA